MNTLWLKDITMKNLPQVGGKGASLGEMFHSFPVPDAFCVTVEAYKKFLKEAGIEKQIYSMLKIDEEDTEKLHDVAEKIQRLMTSKAIPKDVEKDILTAYKKLNGFVAVRSSATAEDLPTASFAGQQATFLNVKGEKDVLEAVKKCWASLFTARAIYYRVKNKFKNEQVFISVVVQKMVDSKKAGVIFTVNPINQNKNEMVIEGAFGLGETVVSGSVTPDTYIIQKNPYKLLNKNIGHKRIALYRDQKGKNFEKQLSEEEAEQQVLSEEQIKKLSEISVNIEKHYRKPMDIEWAVDDKEYILQARPITTLK